MRTRVLLLLLCLTAAVATANHFTHFLTGSPTRARPAGVASVADTPGHEWPPQVGATYPSVELIDAGGAPLRIDQFRGKVVIIEPLGMTCAACNAFSGGNDPAIGGFGRIRPQKGVPSIDELLQEYTNAGLGQANLVFVQILLYDMEMGHPGPADARRWAEHFGLDDRAGVHVAVPRRDLRGKPSYNLIPGFQLIDREGVLRFDATGHQPRHSIPDDLLPATSHMLDGV